jgi:hypothetical protein
MMAMIADVLMWWLPTAGAFAGLPLLSAGLRAMLSVAALLWFGALRLEQLQSTWMQDPWAPGALGVWPSQAEVVQSVASALLMFAGLRLLPTVSALAMRSLGAAEEDAADQEDGASTPEHSLATFHFVLLVTLAVLSDSSGGLVCLVLPDVTPMRAMEATAIAGWLMELLQQSVTQAIGVVAPFLMGGVLADLIVLSVRGARRTGGSPDRWRPVWVLGVLMLVAWSGLTPSASHTLSMPERSETLEPVEVP